MAASQAAASQSPGTSDAELDEQISQMDPAEIAKLKELAKKEQINVLHDDSIDFLRTEDDEKREENEKAAAEAAKDLDLDLGIAEEDGQEPKSTKT